jgi:hypothetical protein
MLARRARSNEDSESTQRSWFLAAFEPSEAAKSSFVPVIKRPGRKKKQRPSFAGGSQAAGGEGFEHEYAFTGLMLPEA